MGLISLINTLNLNDDSSSFLKSKYLTLTREICVHVKLIDVDVVFKIFFTGS